MSPPFQCHLGSSGLGVSSLLCSHVCFLSLCSCCLMLQIWFNISKGSGVWLLYQTRDSENRGHAFWRCSFWQCLAFCGVDKTMVPKYFHSKDPIKKKKFLSLLYREFHIPNCLALMIFLNNVFMPTIRNAAQPEPQKPPSTPSEESILFYLLI